MTIYLMMGGPLNGEFRKIPDGMEHFRTVVSQCVLMAPSEPIPVKAVLYEVYHKASMYVGGKQFPAMLHESVPDGKALELLGMMADEFDEVWSFLGKFEAMS